MSKRAPNEFTEQFAEHLADSDYSRHPQLRGVGESDIRAAAEALWTYARQERMEPFGLMNESSVVTVLLSQVKRWDDEGELVSTEFEEYWDATDELGFSAVLLKDMKRELAAKHLASQRDDHVVVDNREGIWLFSKDALWNVRHGVPLR